MDTGLSLEIKYLSIVRVVFDCLCTVVSNRKKNRAK